MPTAPTKVFRGNPSTAGVTCSLHRCRLHLLEIPLPPAAVSSPAGPLWILSRCQSLHLVSRSTCRILDQPHCAHQVFNPLSSMDSTASGLGGYLPKPDVLLNGQNYKAWSSTMRMHLRGLKLWGHVDGSRPAPPHPDTSSTASSGSTVSTNDPSFQAWAKWQDDDSRAIVVLGQSCEVPIRLAICEFTTARVI